MITSGGRIPRPGQNAPNVIVLTQPKRFGIDIADYTEAVRTAENVDFPRRYKLYDLYSDILMDTHLSSVIEKRRNALIRSELVFYGHDGTPDEKVMEQIRSPWFNRLLCDILDSRFWGFSLCQFFKKGDWVDYTLVPRKHADPVRRLILRQQTDITGTSWDEYHDLLFVGTPDDLGLLAKAAPWVIYKRNTTGDWSQFSEVFGMPIQEYTYDTDDDDSRERAIADAAKAGSLAVFVHGRDTSLNLIEAGNKTGSADVYERFCERCNSEISKLILGNTLTTESSENGTQSLGTVHKKVEDNVTIADRRYVLDVLNYEMSDILGAFGIKTSGGRFDYPEKKDTDTTAKANILVQLRRDFDLPVDDDYLYEEFGIRKPADYDRMKREQAERRVPQAGESGDDGGDDRPDDGKREEDDAAKKRKGRAGRVKRFVRNAPSCGGAALDW